MKNLLLAIAVFFICSSLICTPTAKLGCNGIDFTYGDLEEFDPEPGLVHGYNTVNIFFSRSGSILHNFI